MLIFQFSRTGKKSSKKKESKSSKSMQRHSWAISLPVFYVIRIENICPCFQRRPPCDNRVQEPSENILYLEKQINRRKRSLDSLIGRIFHWSDLEAEAVSDPMLQASWGIEHLGRYFRGNLKAVLSRYVCIQGFSTQKVEASIARQLLLWKFERCSSSWNWLKICEKFSNFSSIVEVKACL